MNVLIAPDKFKGTLTAAEAAQAIAAGVAAFNKDWNVKMIPIADGGEGTAEVLRLASSGKNVRIQASDALFRPVSVEYAISEDGKTAYIDMASASGPQHLRPDERNAMRCSSQGTGQMIANALTKKCKRIILGLGGTATIDCGIGIAQALGVNFSGEDSNRLSPIALNLGKVEFIETIRRRFLPGDVELILLADVENPLLGEEGAMMFAEQKGVKGEAKIELEAYMTHFSNLLEAKFGTLAKTPGMGAAGGAALSCMAFLGGKLTSGSKFVLEMLNVDAAIADADLVITGEGKLDIQSLQGKAPIAVAKMAQKQGKQVLAICGKVELSPTEQQKAGISLSAALINDGEPDPKTAAKQLEIRTIELLSQIAPSLGA